MTTQNIVKYNGHELVLTGYARGNYGIENIYSCRVCKHCYHKQNGKYKSIGTIEHDLKAESNICKNNEPSV